MVEHYYSCRSRCPACGKEFGRSQNYSDIEDFYHHRANCRDFSGLSVAIRDDYSTPAKHFYFRSRHASPSPSAEFLDLLPESVTENKLNLILDSYGSRVNRSAKTQMLSFCTSNYACGCCETATSSTGPSGTDGGGVQKSHTKS